ncbi:MAG: S41 family peptidase [bacterium]|nr:S41 family peptidase [bacterium]
MTVGRFSAFISVLLFMGGSFWVGHTMGRDQARIVPIEGLVGLEEGRPSAVDFSLFWQAWNVIQSQYVDENIDIHKMVQGAISGMVSSVGDPYTVFMDASDTKRFLEDVDGSFEGIGAEIGFREEELRIIAPLKGTPAERSGLRAGDYIIQINGEVTRSMTVEKAVSLIRGKKGTEVVLLIGREAWEAPQDISIRRDTIVIPSLEVEVLEGNIGYIRLYHFSRNAKTDFDKAAATMLDHGVKGIVLDLRNNPGGLLHIAQDMAGWFLDRGQVVVYQVLRSGERESLIVNGNGRLRSVPIVVLINEGSASASEILAGALRDHRGAMLVGQDSFGKGSVQTIENLQDGSSLKVTIARWMTPAGYIISDKGLVVDDAVEMTEEDELAGLDPQRDRAIELLLKIE